MKYIATFHTHLSSLLSLKKLKNCGIEAVQTPTPRILSSSCGVAVRYTAQDDMSAVLDSDFEAIYKIINDKYILIKENF